MATIGKADRGIVYYFRAPTPGPADYVSSHDTQGPKFR